VRLALDRIRQRQAAEEAEARYRSLSDGVPVGLFRSTPDGRLLEANPAFAQILGYPDREALLAVPASALYVDPEERRRLHTTLEREGVVRDFEVRLRRLDGFVVWGLGHVRAVRDASGQVLYHEGSLEDITARKAAESALHERARLAAFAAAVGRVMVQGGSLREILQGCAEAMVTHLEAALARIWTLDATADVLELRASAGLYTHLDGPHGRVPVGQLKIGLIARERRPHLTNAVVGDPRVHDQGWARREGLVAFAGYPLLVEDRCSPGTRCPASPWRRWPPWPTRSPSGSRGSRPRSSSSASRKP
jgi:hypothetical protein